MRDASTNTLPPPSRAARYLGVALSSAVAVALLFDGLTGLLRPDLLAAPMAETGFPLAMLWVVAAAALAAGVLSLIPRTAVLGAILVTGFAGGAIATHVRIGEVVAPPQLICAAFAVAAWGGLWLRDRRVRALLF